jgi:hypothetical protein
MTKLMNKLTNFLYFSAGVNNTILKKCPTEKAKMQSIGAFVILTTIFAAFSGGYAIYSIFFNVFWAIVFSLLWAIMIFNIDRYIVSGIRKLKPAKSQLFMALPRMVVAIIISLVISKPVELKIFSDKIKQNTFEFNRAQKMGIAGQNMNYVDSLYNNPAQKLRNEIAEMQNNIPESYKTLESNMRQLKTDLGLRQREINIANSLINKQISELESQLWSSNNQYQIESLKKKISINNSKLVPIQNEIKKLNKQMTEEWNRYQNELNSLTTSNNDEIARLVTLKKNRQTDLNTDEQNALQMYSANNSLIEQYSALCRLNENDNSMNLISWFITILFLIIELTPIIVKLISHAGPYDYMLEKHEDMFRNYLIEQKEKAEHSRSMRLKMKFDSDNTLMETEKETTKALHRKIADAELEVAQEIINHWKQKEKGNVIENIDMYLHTNSLN